MKETEGGFFPPLKLQAAQEKTTPRTKTRCHPEERVLCALKDLNLKSEQGFC
jgi:hypothetical protein